MKRVLGEEAAGVAGVELGVVVVVGLIGTMGVTKLHLIMECLEGMVGLKRENLGRLQKEGVDHTVDLVAPSAVAVMVVLAMERMRTVIALGGNLIAAVELDAGKYAFIYMYACSYSLKYAEFVIVRYII